MQKLTLEGLKNKWSEYAVLIQENKRDKDAETPYSIVHIHFGKVKFKDLGEIEDWLVLNEVKLAEYAGIPPKNLLVQRYQEREKTLESINLASEEAQETDNKPTNIATKSPEYITSDLSEAAIAGIIDDDSVFNSDKFLEVPETVRNVLKRENSSFYTSSVVAELSLKEKLHSPSLSEAKPFPVVVGILREAGLYVSDEPTRFEISILLAEQGFSVRYFGDPRVTPEDQVLLCIAASKAQAPQI